LELNDFQYVQKYFEIVSRITTRGIVVSSSYASPSFQLELESWSWKKIGSRFGAGAEKDRLEIWSWKKIG